MKVRNLIGLSNAVALAVMESPVLTETSSDAMDEFTDAVSEEFTIEDHQRMILNLIGALSLRDPVAAHKVEETLSAHRLALGLIILGTGGQE